MLLAFATVRLYVLQHDCGHHSLFATRGINDLAGYLLSVFSLTPYRVMQYNHNLHHAYLGNLDHRETTEVHTMTLREWREAGWWTAAALPALPQPGPDAAARRRSSSISSPIAGRATRARSAPGA
ncbi:MAG: fatty acid desaturase [Roseovarius sp.]|nr:fatty acid desaturase [Roseovarius sp.]